MKVISSALIFACFQLIQISAVCSAPPPSTLAGGLPNQESQVLNAVQDLGRKISQAEGTQNPNSNVVLSPLSIATILNLLILGTNGNTNLELRRALNYSDDLQDDVIHGTFQKVFNSLQQSGSSADISLNTRLFPQEDFRILDSYKQNSEKFYSTEVQNLNFRSNSNAALESINNWVSNSTEGKINKIFSMPLSRDTVCVTVNVIFLNATWENKFNSRATRNGFFNTGKVNISIPMMTTDIRIPYLRDNEGRFEIISLPYEGKRYSMYILKPVDSSAGKLQQIENTLDSTYLNSLISQMRTERMLVTIPRMRLSQEDLDLKTSLKSLGVNNVFSEHFANFERFTDKKGLFVNDIFHKAILDVTEEGTTGAAVTVSGISTTSLPSIFSLDRPSLLFIRDDENGLILFWAKVLKPEPFIG